MSLRRTQDYDSPAAAAVGKFGGALSPLFAGELGAVVIKAPMERTGIDRARVDDVVFAQGYASGEAPRGCRRSSTLP